MESTKIELVLKCENLDLQSTLKL